MRTLVVGVELYCFEIVLECFLLNLAPRLDQVHVAFVELVSFHLRLVRVEFSRYFL